MPTGSDVIAAISRKTTLLAIDNCPGVPVQIGYSVYGSFQNDKRGIEIKNDHARQRNINEAIYFGGGKTETSVWHFSTSPVVHHFVVIPWVTERVPSETVYTVLMAYEGKYNLDKYVKGIDAEAPGTEHGYKAHWSAKQLSEMLSELVVDETANAAWKKYFDPRASADKKATKITCYKYKNITLQAALDNI